MSASSIIVLVIDRLGAGWLGSYGNTWVDTPAFNRLASQSLQLEYALAGSPQLDEAYAAYWFGQRPLQTMSIDDRPSLIDIAKQAGMRSLLVTDVEDVAGYAGAGDFDETVDVPRTNRTRQADDPTETQLAQTLAIALERIADADEPTLFWIHAGAMDETWDAPSVLCESLVDEDDPLPPTIVDPPQQRLAETYDPDEVMGVCQAYAGQVLLCDILLDAFTQTIDERDDVLFVCTSPRGFPLGEHLRIGASDNALLGELLHVPMYVRFANGAGAAVRSHAFTQPHDLFGTLAIAANDGRGSEIPVDTASIRNLRDLANGHADAFPDRVCAHSDAEFALRTPAWFLRDSAVDGTRLYAKPDDYWEANEVSDRCQDVVALLQRERELLTQAAGDTTLLPPLPDLLIHGLE